MKFATPRFWSRRLAVASLALIPVSWLYRLGHAGHQRRARPYMSRLPVLCIGNLTAGGSGKTPVALAIAGLVKANGLADKPVFLTRGYGGRVGRGDAILVDPAAHDAALVGDEALLLAAVAPAIVAPDRAAGARLAERSGADLIVMDDGLHNTRLERTLNLVVIDSGFGFGNRRLLPAGPLRTPLRTGLRAADAFICIGGSGPADIRDAGKPVFTARLATAWRPEVGAAYYAFCGLGRPEKFFATLTAQGAILAGQRLFPDHHAYTARDLRDLRIEAGAARLITTAKDAARIAAADLGHYAIETVPVTLAFDDEAAIIAFLRDRLRA